MNERNRLWLARGMALLGIVLLWLGLNTPVSRNLVLSDLPYGIRPVVASTRFSGSPYAYAWRELEPWSGGLLLALTLIALLLLVLGRWKVLCGVAPLSLLTVCYGWHVIYGLNGEGAIAAARHSHFMSTMSNMPGMWQGLPPSMVRMMTQTVVPQMTPVWWGLFDGALLLLAAPLVALPLNWPRITLPSLSLPARTPARPAGTVAQKVDAGPCPVCGQINSHHATRCHACGALLTWGVPHPAQPRPGVATSSQASLTARGAPTPINSVQITRGRIVAGVGALLLLMGLGLPAVNNFSYYDSVYNGPIGRADSEFPFGSHIWSTIQPVQSAIMLSLVIFIFLMLSLSWWRALYVLGPITFAAAVWGVIQVQGGVSAAISARYRLAPGYLQGVSPSMLPPGPVDQYPPSIGIAWLFLGVGSLCVLLAPFIVLLPAEAKSVAVSPHGPIGSQASFIRGPGHLQPPRTSNTNWGEIAVYSAQGLLVFVLCSMAWPLGFFGWRYLDNEDSPLAIFALAGVVVGVLVWVGRFILIMARVSAMP